MKKQIFTGVIVTVSAFLFTGCGGAQPTVNLHKDGTYRFKLEPVAPKRNKAYSKTREKEHECSMHTYLYLAARETLKRGYKYFTLDDPGYGYKYDNNMFGFPITSGEAYDRYCNPANKEPDTGLEDDKCMDRGMFDGITTSYDGYIRMFNKPTYLFPTWDAEETLKREEPKVNACVDWDAYKNASSAKDIKVEE